MWIGTGDFCEYITPDDYRWEAKLIPAWVEEDDISRSQEKYIIEQFKPIADKCIGLAYGNHEYTYAKHKFGNPQKHICDALEVTNLGFSSYIHLLFHRKSSKESHLIKICGTHGASNAITQAGKLNILKRWMDSNDAQIYWYAHMHDILHRSRQYMGTTDNLNIINQEALGVVTGSFYKSYIEGVNATYAERKTYPPNKLGYPVVEINVEKMTLEFSEKVYLRG